MVMVMLAALQGCELLHADNERAASNDAPKGFAGLA